ncbi:uncharacterized protein LOC129587164 [Paramacrobiotus metropolitanus]|uniref:uncharacterized protein LOC129587164 n=1 Tax=Paramacrobiotus metropolitanus TaxID=2943436 RepID=UPI00244595DA|nr:uncharacterized protein LOC129587164 [Paramacrobiotus metropolitanus]
MSKKEAMSAGPSTSAVRPVGLDPTPSKESLLLITSDTAETISERFKAMMEDFCLAHIYKFKYLSKSYIGILVQYPEGKSGKVKETVKQKRKMSAFQSKVIPEHTFINPMRAFPSDLQKVLPDLVDMLDVAKQRWPSVADISFANFYAGFAADREVITLEHAPRDVFADYAEDGSVPKKPPKKAENPPSK